MTTNKLLVSCVALTALMSAPVGSVFAAKTTEIIHDAEYYVLEAQHGEKWVAEDKALKEKLAELKAKHGTPPNIIHIMWDDTAVGEVGVPQIQKARGW